MKISAGVVLEALKKVNEPDLGKDIVTLGLVSDINILETKISFSVQMKNAAMHARKRMEEACAFAIERSVGKQYSIEVNIQAMKKSEANHIKRARLADRGGSGQAAQNKASLRHFWSDAYLWSGAVDKFVF